jgi:hypothetical protein
MKLSFVAEEPKSGLLRRFVGVPISHTNTHMHPVETHWRSLSTQHTADTRKEYPCFQRDSNPRSQQSSDRGPAPYITRPPWSAPVELWSYKFSFSESPCIMIYTPTHLIRQSQNLHKICCPVCFLRNQTDSAAVHTLRAGARLISKRGDPDPYSVKHVERA